MNAVIITTIEVEAVCCDCGQPFVTTAVVANGKQKPPPGRCPKCVTAFQAQRELREYRERPPNRGKGEDREKACTLNAIEFQAICQACGQSFNAVALEFDGKRKVAALVCSVCVKEREERDARERTKREVEDREIAWGRLCPIEFRLLGELGGHTDLAILDARSPSWRGMLKWQFGARGLFVAGPTGTGKTRALWRLLRREWDNGRKFMMMTAGDFDRACRDAGGNFSLSAWFNRLANVPLLAIDDLGKAAWTEATAAQFHELVDTRTRNARPLIVTTNETGQLLQERMPERFGASLVRRLRDYCDVLVMADPFSIVEQCSKTN
jgi:hypothetical protein